MKKFKENGREGEGERERELIADCAINGKIDRWSFGLIIVGW